MGLRAAFGKSLLMTSSSRVSALVTGTLLSIVLVMPSDVAGPGSAVATPSPSLPVSSGWSVTTEAGLRDAWADPRRRRIDLGADIVLRNCRVGDPIRESPYPLVLDGHGHTIEQGCFEKRLLRQDGTGYLDIRDVTLTRGGSDGPGAALTSRGEISLSDCVIVQNLAEEPGGGVFSMRRVTAHRCFINGNLANDDGGAIYARRGGVQVYDSILSNNLVDGSGGAIASTGDILVVRSTVDGNTTDGDGGALYTDEDGDVTVIDSVIDGSAADGPGGGIFTVDGDVAVFGSTLDGNRADDRGGAIAGESDVLVVNSVIARNLAVAHPGGGIWARGDLTLVNTTVADNYAEGEGGGVLSAGRTTLISSTLTRNIAPVAGDVGSARAIEAFASIIGPSLIQGVTGDTIPSRRSCRSSEFVSRGFNFNTDTSCVLTDPTDIREPDPRLARLEDDLLGFVMVPLADSSVKNRIPSGSCRGTLPDPLPAGHLLAPYVDWNFVLTHDALENARDLGTTCDIGAVQTPAQGDPPPMTVRAAPPSVVSWASSLPASVSRPLSSPARQLPSKTAERWRSRSELVPRNALARRLGRLDARVRMLRRSASRFGELLGCTRHVGVDQAGDPQHRWGFMYDERDGTGIDLRPALEKNRGGGPDLVMLRLSASRKCLSSAPDPNGTGEDARGAAPRLGIGAQARRTDVLTLLRRLRRLEQISERVATTTERFDEWESCLSWLPVTEAGDADQDLGYLHDDSSGRHHLPAIDIDDSERDDPDYELLVFRGRDRPFRDRECGGEPGEQVDRPTASRTSTSRDSGTVSPLSPSNRPPLVELRSGLRSLQEDVADLIEPVGEIVRFDECMYTVGVQNRPGYLYRGRSGAIGHRAALSFDMRGSSLPQMNMMAISGEEPPQIECNEDAGLPDDDD